jgi:acetolactate synthase-1/3 small subunit
MLKRNDQIERHTISVLVDNEPGVLARVIGLFSGRGYNIDSLTVSETEQSAHLSRLIPVHSVADLTVEGSAVERELSLIKVAGKGEKRVEALRLADAFRAKIVDASIESFIFELTGKPAKIDQFIALMQPLGLVEVCRTGIAAIARGAEGMKV